MMRYFKLIGSDGVWPNDHPIQVGTIIRSRHDVRPGDAVWNDDFSGWAYPVWQEVPNPAGDIS